MSENEAVKLLKLMEFSVVFQVVTQHLCCYWTQCLQQHQHPAKVSVPMMWSMIPDLTRDSFLLQDCAVLFCTVGGSTTCGGQIGTSCVCSPLCVRLSYKNSKNVIYPSPSMISHAICIMSLFIAASYCCVQNIIYCTGNMQ